VKIAIKLEKQHLWSLWENADVADLHCACW